MKVRVFSIVSCLAMLLFSCGNQQKGSDQQSQGHGGPQIGGPGMGGNHRPAPSAELQKVIDETVPHFTQHVFVNEKGDSLQYNLFSPKGIEDGKSYPLVLFMADASTPGPDVLTPRVWWTCVGGAFVSGTKSLFCACSAILIHNC